MERLANLIGGKHAPPRCARWLECVDPAIGAPYALVPDSADDDVFAAVSDSHNAFPAWSATPAAERSRLLFRLADLIDANTDSLAQAESRDTGKPITLARNVDIPRSAANLRYFAGAVLHTSSEMHETDQPATGGPIHAINYTLRRPRGVAGLITPWNLPLYLLTWKLAPALATGNTAVCKPSEVTPMTAHLLGQLSLEAGLPPGVLNIVHGTGRGAGVAIIQHPQVPTLSFTGSTLVGMSIAAEAGPRLKRISLELGGKNPFLIFDDANLAEAIPTAVRAGFTNQGQICLCGSRLLVQRSIFRRVLDDIVQRVKALKVGDPMDPTTDQGALTSRAHLDKVETYVALARKEGGAIHCGGERVPPSTLPERCRAGFFYHPTVISGLDPACRVEQEEIFGPVITMQLFDDDDHAIALANGTPYGLAATVCTENLGRAHRIADRLHSGIVWVNCWMVRDLRTPFGGVKQSGVGREGGLEAIKFFTEPKNVCVRL